MSVTRKSDAAAEIGTGFLSRAAAVVYWLLVVELLLVAAMAPGLVLLLFVGRDASNAPLYGLCFVPVAPALSAAVFAWRVFLSDRDLSPARHFLRGYRLNVVDVLRWWVPALALLTCIGFTLANLDVSGVPRAYGLVLLTIAGAALVWACHALVLSSTLSLRTRDITRLALYYLGARPMAAIGALGLLLAAGALVCLGSDWVLVLLASPFTFALLHNAKPVLQDATVRFTA
ncbi:hypothetical protein [Flindersiella endophytica]